MSMIEVKTAELSGAALDWAIGNICASGERRLYPDGVFWRIGPFGNFWNPSADWSQGGPLIEKYMRELSLAIAPYRDFFEATNTDAADGFSTPGNVPAIYSYGSTPLIAACRAIVAARLGDTVRVPAELLP